MAFFNKQRVLQKYDTKYGPVEVVEKVYSSRPSRLLYSGIIRTAQSGIPLDNNDQMLFGYNQRFIELVDQLDGTLNILVIGGGVLTLPSKLMSKNRNYKIDVVEPNIELIDIAKRYFSLKDQPKLSIYSTDGVSYLKSSKLKYDLVIVDVFHEDKIPEDILSLDFINLLSRAIKTNGMVAMNIISSLRSDSVIRRADDLFTKKFNKVILYPADESNPETYFDHNFILLALNGDQEIRLKYPAISASY